MDSRLTKLTDKEIEAAKAMLTLRTSQCALKFGWTVGGTAAETLKNAYDKALKDPAYSPAATLTILDLLTQAELYQC